MAYRRVKVSIPGTIISIPTTKTSVPPICPEILLPSASYPSSSIPQLNGTIGAYPTQVIPPALIITPSTLPLDLTLTAPTTVNASFDLATASPSLISYLNGLTTALNTYSTSLSAFLTSLLSTILQGFLSTMISLLNTLSATYTALIDLSVDIQDMLIGVETVIVNSLIAFVAVLGTNIGIGIITNAAITLINTFNPLVAPGTGVIPGINGSVTAIIGQLQLQQTAIGNYITTLNGLLLDAQALVVPVLTLPAVPTTLPVDFTLTIPTGTTFNFGNEAFPTLSTPALTVPSLTGVPVVLPNIPANIITLPDVTLQSLHFTRPIIVPGSDICTEATCAIISIEERNCRC
jgi:hypothetical protein